jgi:hypothetical protein
MDFIGEFGALSSPTRGSLAVEVLEGNAALRTHRLCWVTSQFRGATGA